MKRVVYFRLGSREIHMPRLIGAFILFASLLMFIKASADTFNSWDVLKNYEKCINNIDSALPIDLQSSEADKCKQYLKDNTGLSLPPYQAKPTVRQFWSALLAPIAALLFWLAVLLVGLVLYRTGDIILPIEETVKELPESTQKTKKEMKRKGK
ncbi:MAG: hypothetical protein N3D73_01785 [Candidatus Diapherotrites archaeon]|nr:hypothetical protein [Candidatus Diapherotrites archaeon]